MVYNSAMTMINFQTRRNLKHLGSHMFTSLLCSLFFFACSGGKQSPQDQNAAPPQQPEVPKTVLSISGKTFTTIDFDRFVQFKYSGMSDVSDISDRLKSRFFDSFSDHALLIVSAEEEGVTISEGETAAYLSDLKIVTDNHDETALKEEALIQKYLFNRVYNQIDVDIRECQDFYKKHRNQFRKNKQIMLHQILLKDQKRAFEIKEILESTPSRFEEFALSESQSIDAKNNGTMGFFEQGQLPQEIEKIVFSLKKNDISQVIESPYGFHIFRVSQIREGHDLYFESVKDEIKNNLLSDKLHQAYDSFLTDLKEKHEIISHFENLPFKYVSNEYGGNNDPTQ